MRDVCFLHLIFFINNRFSFNLFWITRFERYESINEPFVRRVYREIFCKLAFFQRNCDRGGLKPDDTLDELITMYFSGLFCEFIIINGCWLVVIRLEERG